MEDLEASALCNLSVFPDCGNPEEEPCDCEACECQSYGVSHFGDDQTLVRDLPSLVQVKRTCRSYLYATYWALCQVKVMLYTVELAKSRT